MNEKILVVDDEDWVLEMVRSYLEDAGFLVTTASDGLTALERLPHDEPDVVVLDWMLPGLDGLAVAERIRRTSDVPIIMLTARADEEDRIEGLETGADDYVVKPFSTRELEARIRAVLRRAEGSREPSEVLQVREIRVHRGRREVRIGDREVRLTPMEFDLLSLLMQRPGRVFNRVELLRLLRGSTYETFERSIDAHVTRLRGKIEPDPANPRYVLTVFGVGYKLASEASE